MNRRLAVGRRAATRRWCAVAVVAASVLVVSGLARRAACAAEAGSTASEPAPASPSLPPSLLLFGDEHDPDRPPPPVLQPGGKGIVATSVVAAGAAQVLEYEGEAKDLSAVLVDVRIEAGSTTPDFTAASVRARAGHDADAAPAGPVPLLGACVLSQDASVMLSVAAGSRRAGWTVHIDDREFLCADASTRLAVLMPGGSFRLSAKAGAEAGARLLLVFGSTAADLSTLELPGATLKLRTEAPQ